MITGMGAYLGEVVVRNGGGQWTYHPGQPPAIREAHSRQRLYIPYNKVAKRLTVGPEHSLLSFYEAVMTGETPPGTVIIPRDPPSRTPSARSVQPEQRHRWCGSELLADAMVSPAWRVPSTPRPRPSARRGR